MRIISKFHDFYDQVQYQYGSDSNVWERKTFVDDKNLITDWTLLPKSYDPKEHKNKFGRYGYGVLAIGKLFITSYYVMDLNDDDGICKSSFTFYDNEDDLKKRIGSKHKWYRFFQRHHRNSNYEYDLAKKFVSTHREKTNEPIFTSFPMVNLKMGGSGDAWYDNSFPNGSVLVNPPMHPLGKLIKSTLGDNHEVKVYNAIEEYVLERNLEKIPDITDNNIKIDAHGFDQKKSFRNVK